MIAIDGKKEIDKKTHIGAKYEWSKQIQRQIHVINYQLSS